MVSQAAQQQINFSEPIPTAHCLQDSTVRIVSPVILGSISHVKVELPSPSPSTSHGGTPSPPTSHAVAQPALPLSITNAPGSLLSQMNALGPTDRCTPSQAQAMGQQVLAVIALHEKNTLQLPRKSAVEGATMYVGEWRCHSVCVCVWCP